MANGIPALPRQPFVRPSPQREWLPFLFSKFFAEVAELGLLAGQEFVILSAMAKLPDITIPNDLPSCRALIQKLARDNSAKDQQLQDQNQQLRRRDIARQEQEQTFDKLTQDYEELQLAYNKLLQQRFGNRSERYLESPDQLRLDLGDTDEAADAAIGLNDAIEDLEQTIPAHRRRKPRQPRDERLPEHLPRYEVTADVPDDLKHCPTHGERTLLPESMWDMTESLEFERPKLKVRVTKYPKYACSGQPECGIAMALEKVDAVATNHDTSSSLG